MIGFAVRYFTLNLMKYKSLTKRLLTHTSESKAMLRWGKGAEIYTGGLKQPVLQLVSNFYLWKALGKRHLDEQVCSKR